MQILWVAKSYTMPGAGVMSHSHPYFHMFYIHAGQSVFTVNGKEYVLEAGQTLLVPRQVEHAYSNKQDAVMEYLEIKFTLAQSALDAQLMDLGPLVSAEPLAGMLFRQVLKEYSDLEGLADEAAASYLEALLHVLTEKSRYEKQRQFRFIDASTYNALSQTIIRYLEEHYAEDLSLDALAAALGYNKSYLCVAFKRDTHSTILDFLNMIRIRRAAELIVYSDHSLTQVADMCGFASDSHFNRVFVKYVGTTPGQCRRAYPVNILFESTDTVELKDRPSRFMYSVLAQKYITPQMIRELDELEKK